VGGSRHVPHRPTTGVWRGGLGCQGQPCHVRTVAQALHCCAIVECDSGLRCVVASLVEIVSYIAQPGASVMISGGVSVHGWTETTIAVPLPGANLRMPAPSYHRWRFPWACANAAAVHVVCLTGWSCLQTAVSTRWRRSLRSFQPARSHSANCGSTARVVHLLVHPSWPMPRPPPPPSLHSPASSRRQAR